VTTQGPKLERHSRFPQGVNAGYFELVDRHRIKLRVWERGAGETLSCGTGACAAAVTAIERKLADSPIQVETRGGTLTITWQGGDNPVIMKGPAQAVFEGTLELEER
jgi:diaminopimelate epimerase